MAPPDDAHASDDRGAHALPRQTTPTWEVELLISGVAVFAMLQLPGWLGDRLFDVLPRVDIAWGKALEIFYVYLTCAAVILAGTFALHLLLRAQWIALVGMHSVHPDGIRWERMRMGPLQRRIEQQRRGDIAAAIERADNRATTVFALGVVLASNLLKLSLLFGITLLGRWLAAALFQVHLEVMTLLLAALAVLLVPFAAARLIDERMGGRLAPSSRGRRLLERVLEGYSRLGIGRRSVAMALHASHDGERRTSLIAAAIMVVTVTGVMFSLRGQLAPQRVGQYAAFPDAAALPGRALDGAHYDDQRDPLHDPAVPYIPAMVASGPYLKLVVPYRPEAEALPRDCDAGSQGGARDAALLACLERRRAVAMDGAAMPALRYDIGSDPRTDRPALVAMIDVRALPPGRHVLEIARMPGGDASRAADRIAFWR